MPAFIKGTQAILDYVKANKKAIQENVVKFFQKMTKALGILFNVAVKAFKILNNVIQFIGGWGRTLKILSVVFAGIASYKIIGGVLMLAKGIRGLALAFGALVTSISPLTLLLTVIVGLSTAIALFADDYKHFQKGLPSFIGQIKDAHPTLFKILQVFEQISSVIVKGIAWGIRQIVDDITTLYNMIMKVKDIFMAIGGGIPKLFDAISIKSFQPKDLRNKGDVTITSNPTITINTTGGDAKNIGETVKEVVIKEWKTVMSNVFNNISVTHPIS